MRRKHRASNSSMTLSPPNRAQQSDPSFATAAAPWVSHPTSQHSTPLMALPLPTADVSKFLVDRTEGEDDLFDDDDLAPALIQLSKNRRLTNAPPPNTAGSTLYARSQSLFVDTKNVQNP